MSICKTLSKSAAALLLATSALVSANGLAHADDAEPYKFAVLGPLSGDNAVYGESLQWGVQLAADQINAAGGIKGHKIELEFLDTQCQATQAASAAAKVASDSSVVAVIGDVCSSATIAAIPILSRAGISIMSGSSSSDKVTDLIKTRGFKNFARTMIRDGQLGVGMTKLAIDVMKKKKIAILYANDDFGQPLAKYQENIIKQKSELVASETYTPTTTKDFTAQLTKIAAAKPDVIMLDGYYNDMGTAVAQMARVGLTGVTIIASAGVDQTGFMELAGDAAEGAYVFSNYNPANTSDANATFVKEYQARYKTDPNEQAVFGYEIPFIYKMAFEQGADKSNLATVARSLTFVGPTGKSTFDENGDVIGKTGVVDIVKGGKLTFDAELTKAVNN